MTYGEGAVKRGWKDGVYKGKWHFDKREGYGVLEGKTEKFEGT